MKAGRARPAGAEREKPALCVVRRGVGRRRWWGRVLFFPSFPKKDDCYEVLPPGPPLPLHPTGAPRLRAAHPFSSSCSCAAALAAARSWRARECARAARSRCPARGRPPGARRPRLRRPTRSPSATAYSGCTSSLSPGCHTLFSQRAPSCPRKQPGTSSTSRPCSRPTAPKERIVIIQLFYWMCFAFLDEGVSSVTRNT